MRIETHEQLIEFISRPDITLEQAREVTGTFLRIIVIDYEETKGEFVQKVKDFVSKFKNTRERPIFLLDSD